MPIIKTGKAENTAKTTDKFLKGYKTGYNTNIPKKQKISIVENETVQEDAKLDIQAPIEKPRFLSIYGSAGPQKKNVTRYSMGNSSRLAAINHNSYFNARASITDKSFDLS